jgi:hypothetical protein
MKKGDDGYFKTYVELEDGVYQSKTISPRLVTWG